LCVVSLDIMIKVLANLSRGVSYVFGVAAPPPGENERPFVFMWLGIIVFGAALSALLLYLILTMHVS
jgi:nucleoside permease NupC